MSYSQEYENTLDFSPTFQKYSQELVDRLTKRYGLHQKNIIEIGCGKGDFLKMICRNGCNKGYGFDKSYDPSLEEDKSLDSVKFIQDFILKNLRSTRRSGCLATRIGTYRLS